MVAILYRQITEKNNGMIYWLGKNGVGTVNRKIE